MIPQWGCRNAFHDPPVRGTVIPNRNARANDVNGEVSRGAPENSSLGSPRPSGAGFRRDVNCRGAFQQQVAEDSGKPLPRWRVLPAVG
jgi:hypothetical protein